MDKRGLARGILRLFLYLFIGFTPALFWGFLTLFFFAIHDPLASAFGMAAEAGVLGLLLAIFFKPSRNRPEGTLLICFLLVCGMIAMVIFIGVTAIGIMRGDVNVAEQSNHWAAEEILVQSCLVLSFIGPLGIAAHYVLGSVRIWRSSLSQR